LKTYELESFLKSFLIFSILLELLLSLNFWSEYQIKKVELEEKIHIEMKLCAFTLECANLQTYFVDKDRDKEENIFYKDGDFYSYFKVPSTEKYLMQVVYPKTNYVRRVERLESKLYRRFWLYSMFARRVCKRYFA